ncbi:CaiB/BaiF CoA transferase family protein [Pseudonocardia lacus]|uniref:CaiB/BaiF CoA transferase family protein n=1 Tax=Pseudonocardia lacus TaxID=2835865 RepID=UPI001BDDBFC3|nr:CoA transferase [Pseudonocardia lacus]
MAGTGPLRGIRVFDMTVFMVGPWASMHLGALGADVIHVERPLSAGSGIPEIPPQVNGMSAGYIAWNMNKRGIALDLKSEAGRRRAVQIAGQCDVFLVNMRTGVAERLGLGYDELKAINPGLVYCSITGWGRTGPLADEPATDVVVQAVSGFWSAAGAEGAAGEFHRHYTQLDATTGNAAAQAVLMGLLARRRTGRGTRIDITMLQSAAGVQALPLGSYLATGQSPQPSGSASGVAAPDEAFGCRDGRYVGVSVRTPGQWTSFCAALGKPEWEADPRFATNADRMANRAELRALLTAEFAAYPLDYWLLQSRRHRVPAAHPRGFEEIRRDVQVRDNGYLVEMETPWARVTTGGPPWRFSRTPAAWHSPTPGIGQHDADVDTEFGVAASDPAVLR